MNTKLLEETVARILNGNKGIFAADESPGTMGKRFAPYKMENSPENRHAIRKTFFSTPDFEKYIGGVILHDETLRKEETIKDLNDKGIVLGIKTDGGLDILKDGEEGEQTTKGLDTLDERNKEYFKLGARFAKWRNVLLIGEKTPSQKSFEDAANIQAKYAINSQKNGIVPIIEPEVLPNGNHSIDECYKNTEKIIRMTLEACEKENVHMPGCLLKINMVTSGQDNDNKALVLEVAEKTVKCLESGIGSHKIGGVVFLSGGLSEKNSSNYLSEINKEKIKKGTLANIPIHFSYARALQATAIKMYCSENSDKEKVQKCIAHRCRINHEATKGKYAPDMEGEFDKLADESLFVANNNY